MSFQKTNIKRWHQEIFLLERGTSIANLLQEHLELNKVLGFKKIIQVVAPDIWGGTRHLFFNRGTPRCLKGTKQNNVHLHLFMENQKNFSLLFLIYHKIRVLQFQKELSLSLFPLIRQAKFSIYTYFSKKLFHSESEKEDNNNNQ